MNEFYEFLKKYISDKFSADKDIVASVLVSDADMVGHKPNSTQNEVFLEIMDDYENTRTTTFMQGETTSVIPVQFTAFVGQQKIAGEMKKARAVARIFGDKIKGYINELKINTAINPNIVGCRHTTTSPALPVQDGEKNYLTAVRYEFVVNYPYVGE